MDLKETIKSIKTANPGMVDFLESITEGTKFKKFDADPNWKKTVGTILTIKVDLTDVDAVSKKLGIDKKTVASRKVVDVNLESLLGIKVKGKVNKIRFREYVGSSLTFLEIKRKNNKGKESLSKENQLLTLTNQDTRKIKFLLHSFHLQGKS